MGASRPDGGRDPAPQSQPVNLTERYILEAELASGGQGIVYRARDRQSGELVIIKQLLGHRRADPTSVARFLREAEALRLLAHPNIVRMQAAFELEDGPAIVMEYVPGGSLRQLLERQPRLPVPQVLDIALELADALVRAHHLGILHRDIKPENVLLTAAGEPRLTDFGAAQLQTDDARLTRTDVVVGSPAYMSPEALYGEKLDAGSDIWSFGVLLYEMLAGQRPFVAETASHVMVKILQESAPALSSLRPDLPPPLVDLVNAMLVKQRTARLNSMRLVASALEAIRAGRAPQGLPPSPATATGDDLPAASVMTPPSISQHLPAHHMPFLGREKELRELATLLGDPHLRLLTIMGPGGIGKTQLALQAARSVLSTFADGVFFVPLAPLSTPDEIVFAIAKSIDLHFYRPSDAAHQLFEHLQRKEMLLVLDNFEHLLDGASLLAEMIQAAPRVTLLVTSRASLNLSFQHLYTLGGLSFPDKEAISPEEVAGYASVDLLLQQIRLVRPDFAPDAAELQSAAQVARLVQGMPLALVLAARWAELLPMVEIAGEIARNLDFLDTTMRDLPPRQRSMRAVFDYSWQQLSPSVRQTFARLSVFRGGFTREAATEVTGATLRDLLDLVRKSFLATTRSGRYEVHELMRQFGEEQLEASGDARQVCDAHSSYYMHFLGRREADIKGRRQVEALREIEADSQNIRRAWNWALHNGHRQAIDEGLETLHIVYDIRGRHQEAIELFAAARQALAPSAGQQPDLLWTRIVIRHGFLQVLIPGDAHEVHAELQKGLTLAQDHADKYEMAVAYQALATLAVVMLQDPAQGSELGQRARDLFQELGDAFFESRALVNIGICAAAMADPIAFAENVQAAVKVARAAGDKSDVALGLANLTEYAIGMGQYSSARDYCGEAIAYARELDSAPIIAYCQAWLACLDLLDGDLDSAATLLHESMALAGDIHSLTAMAYGSGLSAVLAALQGDYQTARHLAAQSHDNPANNTLGLIITPWAFSLAATGLQDYPTAWDSLREALRQAHELGFPAPVLWLLPVAAYLLAQEGQHERAAELLPLATSHPLSPTGWHAAWRPLDELRARLSHQPDAGALAAARERGAQLDPAAIVQQLIRPST